MGESLVEASFRRFMYERLENFADNMDFPICLLNITIRIRKNISRLYVHSSTKRLAIIIQMYITHRMSYPLPLYMYKHFIIGLVLRVG